MTQCLWRLRVSQRSPGIRRLPVRFPGASAGDGSRGGRRHGSRFLVDKYVSQSYSFAVDALLNRAYFMTDDSSIAVPGQMTFEGFNLTTQAPTWLARFPSSNPLGGRMIRWGSNGIAFVGGTAAASPNITLISGSIVSR
jgi:hypothetical protein